MIWIPIHVSHLAPVWDLRSCPLLCIFTWQLKTSNARQTLNSKNSYWLKFPFEGNTWNQFCESVSEALKQPSILGGVGTIVPPPYYIHPYHRESTPNKPKIRVTLQSKTKTIEKSTRLSPMLSVMWITGPQSSCHENRKASLWVTPR